MRYSLLAAGFAIAGCAHMDETNIDMKRISADGVGESVGAVIATDSDNGLMLTPNLAGLPAGEHGFHIHQNPSCDPAEKNGAMVAGLSAGGHYDPEGTGTHKGPTVEGGHLGDLPRLVVADDGTATTPVTAPRLTVADIVGRALMVHAHGDNYSDDPKPLGGGGARIACGVIE
ncbi:MAG: superoxide dismutase family protein [Woeseiaceae bacterium]|nr:superoxide dismutase family protein [Woeseiaceae bacterium]